MTEPGRWRFDSSGNGERSEQEEKVMKGMTIQPISHRALQGAAWAQARDRAEREGAPMYVYDDGKLMYVRSEEEGVPEGSRRLGILYPQVSE